MVNKITIEFVLSNLGKKEGKFEEKGLILIIFTFLITPSAPTGTKSSSPIDEPLEPEILDLVLAAPYRNLRVIWKKLLD